MLYIVVAVLVLAADQAVKFLTRANMTPGQSISVIGNFFRITYIQNRGAALGMFSGQSKLLMVLPLVVIAGVMIFIYLNKFTNPLVKYALTLISAGGAGNVVDRILFGQVTDMFSFSIFPPVFNVADIAVTLGCFLILVYVLFGEKISGRQKARNRRNSSGRR